MNTPTLIPVDLSKGRENKHPDIKLHNTKYLIKYGGNYFAGYFTEVWFGLSFVGWYAPLQFDTPGYNLSRWEAVWEIVE